MKLVALHACAKALLETRPEHEIRETSEHEQCETIITNAGAL